MRVLSRISFGAYLCYPLAMGAYYALLPNSMVNVMILSGTHFLINQIMCYFMATVFYLLVEEPGRRLGVYLF
jgi:peptidoglycan/LPS O-acetylase OafA/YrhL